MFLSTQIAPFLKTQLFRNFYTSLKLLATFPQKKNLSKMLIYLAVVTQKEPSGGQSGESVTQLSQNYVFLLTSPGRQINGFSILSPNHLPFHHLYLVSSFVKNISHNDMSENSIVFLIDVKAWVCKAHGRKQKIIVRQWINHVSFK